MPYAFDKKDAEVVLLVQSLLRKIISAAANKPHPSPAGEALLCFLARAANSWRSLSILLNSCASVDEFDCVALDCGTLIRCIYDAYIQAAYIGQDPAKRDQRGTLYLEYTAIEKYRQMQPLLGQKNPLAQLLQDSPLRREGEARCKEEYDRVRGNYLKPSGNGVRDHWYEPASLFDLASLVGERELYEWFVKQFNGCVHSGALAARYGPALPKQMIYLALSPVGKIAALFVNLHDIQLTEDEQELLDGCATGPLQD